MKEGSQIRILMVEDHLIARYGVRGILSDEPDIEIVGEARNGREAVDLFAQVRPDLVLMDLRLPDMDGSEATAAIRSLDPAARVLVLSSYDADEDIRQALQAGATGYVMKEANADELVQAIRKVHSGERYLSPRVAARLAQGQQEPQITAREREVLQLMAKGLSNREIARILSLSAGTVRIYSSQIFAKLTAGNRAEAVAIALDRGIIRP